MDENRQIAQDRIRMLFELAKEKIQKEPELAHRYVAIARKIAMRARLKLPAEYRRMVCRHCKSFIYPGVNCRVRVQQKREPHMVVTCQLCGETTRIPLRKKRSNKKA